VAPQPSSSERALAGHICPVQHGTDQSASINTGCACLQEPLSALAPTVAGLPADEDALSSVPMDSELLKLPKGFHWYETMLVLRASLPDDQRWGPGRDIHGSRAAGGAHQAQHRHSTPPVVYGTQLHVLLLL
jgi:hypothetical protein